MLNRASRSRSAVGRIDLRFRRGERASAQAAADDAHQRRLATAAGRTRDRANARRRPKRPRLSGVSLRGGFARRRLAITARPAHKAAFAIGDHIRALVGCARHCGRLFAVAARAVEFALQFLARRALLRARARNDSDGLSRRGFAPRVIAFAWAIARDRRRRKNRRRESRDELRAELLAQHPRAHLLDRALREFGELERAERDANEPRDVEAEMAEHVAHLAVLALADGKGEPEVRALHALDRGFDGAVMDAGDGDARRATRRAAPGVTVPWARTR